ncbi:Fc.00g026250.m01.CDS01 [Cosmosporella sp. VM-42]
MDHTQLRVTKIKATSRARTACLQCRSQKIRCIRCDYGCLSCVRSGKDCSFAASSTRFLESISVESPDVCGSISASPWTGTDGLTKSSPRSPSDLLYERFRERTLDSFMSQTAQHNAAGKNKPGLTWLPDNASIAPRDIRTLAGKGCFDIPNEHALDQLFQHYFWHVHPLFPIIDEVSFWEMHRSTSTVDLVINGKLSLLVLYGILYTASSYVSTNLIESLGFPTIHQATSAFYARGKLLYESGFEQSPISIAQGSLLLSHCYLTQAPRILSQESTDWLRTGIQHARESGAHKYHELPSPATAEIETLRQTLKRLWWCCIFRDRVMSLAGRKDIQITRSIFDFDRHSPLGMDDLAEEIQHSAIYDTGVKRSLVNIVTKVGELCVILTDVLSVSVSGAEDAGYTLAEQAEHANRIRTCRSSLKRWYDSMLRLQLDSRQMYTSRSNDLSESSIVLFTNVLLTYYHSANIALCHQEMIILGVDSSPGRQRGCSSDTDQIQLANSQLIQCLAQVVQLRLAHWLPLGAAACAIVPLALQIVDLKLMSTASTSRSYLSPEAAMLKDRQEKFACLIEAMEKCRARFLAIDWLLNCVRVSAESFHQLLCSQASPWSSNGQLLPSQSWTQTFQKQPKFYLSLATSMDFSVRVGELPGATDLSTRWRMIGRPKRIPASILQSADLSESLSLGDMEILTHIEDHYTKLWGNDENPEPDDEYEPTDGVIESTKKGFRGDGEEFINAYDYMKQYDVVHQPAPRIASLGSNYPEHEFRLPRRWMEEMAVLSV